MRAVRLLAFGLGIGAGACTSAAPGPPPTEMQAYVEDPSVGRRALEQSLVRTDNTYATLRLTKYDAAHWGSLPESNPFTAPMAAGSGRPTAPPPNDPAWAAIDGDSVGYDVEELRTLGEQAFFRYPLQISEAMPEALATGDRAGVWEHEGRLGAVWVQLPGGRAGAAFTCATCHASKSGERLVVGRNNADLD